MRKTPPVPFARHGQLRRPGAAGSVFSFISAVLAVAIVSSVSVGVIAVYTLASSVKPGIHLLNEAPVGDKVVTAEALSGSVNVLLAGSDSGGGDVATFGKRGEHLNDVTMLLHVSADHTRATVVSFPRDLIVPIASCPKPGGGNYPAQTNKMNVALTFGGLPCIVKTVENLTGMAIPYAGLIEFQGVIAMSDAVGGVQVCVATAIHDEQISFNLEAGTPTIQGDQALQFLRSRYGVGDGSDLGRISNQQVFLSALVRKLTDADTLGNPVTLYQIASAAARHISLSDSLTQANTIVSVALTLKNIAPANITFVQYPGVYGVASGLDGVLPVASAAEVLFAALASDSPVTVTGGTGIGSKQDPSAPPSVTTAPPVTGDAAVRLPSVIQGQTAAQQTCSKGQRARAGH